MDAAEDEPAQPVGQASGDAPGALEALRLAAPLDLPREDGPEELQDLRRHDHGRGAQLAQGLEDDARVARADVEHLGADRRGVEEHRRLLEEVRERQDARRPGGG